ncbi:hypothetical protein U27_03973 [Candidatus Vecturithrix granuli]|uniref:SGNH hydrolase-type esterase domain-containing protein n=1 Tax=Vecturithrix granuli TaxID=1499967 RepID=A0A081BXF4_VECG1|nr:hypothetical protein U27_03973 [Candidatus Vecturithrix granuli]
MFKQPSSTFLTVAGLTLICVLFFSQLLFSGEIINATDILTQQYFWSFFIHENLFTDPCFQTWLPYINAGTPFSGGLDLVFQPVTLLTLLLFPAHIAINYEVVLYLFFMGVGMYLYMRELRLSQLSAFLAALFFMLNGEIVSLINAGHVNKIGAISPTPLVFWALERALRRKTLSAFLLTGAALGFQFWHSHVQISYYICIAVGIYFVMRVGLLYRQQRDLKQFSRFIVLGIVMVLVFLLLSAVRFLPLISFAQVSERAEGVSYEFATSWSMPPEELVTYIIPGFFGFRRANHYEDEQNVLDVPYWGRMPFTQTGRYFGILPLLLVGLALCFVRNKHVLTLGVIALIVLLLGMGQYIPIYKLLYAYIPGFNMFRVPQMILFLFAFATSALAGFGAEWLIIDLTEQKARRLRLFVLGGIILFLLCWLLTIYLSHADHEMISGFKDALLRKEATQEIAVQRFKNISAGLLRFDVIFGLSLFVLGLRLAANVRLRWFLAAFLALYLLDIGWFNAKYIDTISLEGSIYTSENDSIRYFKEHPGMYRILQATNTPESYGTFNKYLYHHLYSVSGYEAVGVQYYNEYLENMILGSPLVDLLNVRYIIVSKETQINEETPEVGKQFGPYNVVMNADAVLLENSHYLPRAFAVHQAQVLPSKNAIFSTLLDPSFDPREIVLVERELPSEFLVKRSTQQSVSSRLSRVDIIEYRHRIIRLKAEMADDGFLVLSEKYYPGWKAFVDGKQTDIYKANYTFQAIYAPKGSHEIIFTFQPTQFQTGLWITVLTGIGLCGFFIYEKRRASFPACSLPGDESPGCIPPPFQGEKSTSVSLFPDGELSLSKGEEVKEETPVQEQVSQAKKMRHPGNVIKNVSLIVISVILAIILIEILMQNSAMFQHGGDLAPRNDPNLTWQKPAGITRIMIVGDSLTFGDGVKATETYPYQLKEKLHSRLDGQFQVVNLGIMELNTDQQALILTRSNPYFGEPVLKLDPDLVILTFSVDDIEGRPDSRERPEINLLPRDVHQFLSDRSRLYLLLHRTFNDALSSTGIRPSYSAYLQRLYREHSPKWQEFQQSLNLFMDTVQQAQKPMLLVIFPALEHLDETHPFLDLYAHVKDLASAKGVEVLNLFPAFYGKDASALRVSLLNNHPNAQAYEIAAEAIYNTLIEKNLVTFPLFRE